MSATTNTYSEDNIQILEGLEAVRKRPAMYIGDVGSRGLHHLIWEVVDNSIDEALAGYCTDIWVTIRQDGSIAVQDNGRGIPVGIQSQLGKSALEVVMTVLHAGGKFDKDTYKVSGGLHGVGVSCVNALSIKLVATVERDGGMYRQEYSEGIPLYDVKQIGSSDKTGTLIEFWVDGTIFTTTEYKYETVANRLRELSYLNKGIRISLTDERELKPDGTPLQDNFFSEGGISEYVTYLDADREVLLPYPIYVELTTGPVPVEVAMTYNKGYAENVFSYVNNINTIEGGTHVAGFRSALTRTLKAYADKSKVFEKLKLEIKGDDFREGLTAVISVKVGEPQFEGQTKTKLGNNEVSGAVNSAVGEALATYLEEHPKEAKYILDKVILSAQARSAAEKARAAVTRKGVLTGGGLPGKLADCADNDPNNCELFLVEGDSAGGSAKQGRNRHFQAILPLKGKILNVEKAQEHKIYDNDEIRNMMMAMGVSIGRGDDSKAVNLEKLRYYKIIIMTDADIDGSHIRTLILTFYFRYMRAIIEQGYLFIAQPPLYLVKKGKEEIYCFDEAERDAAIKKIAKDGRDSSVHVQRYKGLGEMNPEQLWETTMNPEHRKLKLVNIESAAEADHLFSMLMGDEVAPRREFIERNAKYARIDV